MHKTAAIIVTYNPQKNTLINLVEKLASQSCAIFIIDNGSSQRVDTWFSACSGEISIINLDDNLGIAKAQNIGIERAINIFAKYVVFFDQDSDPSISHVEFLVSEAEKLEGSGVHVACLGPKYIDIRRNISAPFTRIEGFRLVRSPPSCEGVIPVDHLISSGSLIPTSTLEKVGGMCEELFIDYVDLEWCERAKYMGFQTFGVSNVVMKHALGDEPIVFLGSAYPARSPLRHYYMFRNAVWIYKQNWPRLNWKLVDALRLFRKYVFYSLFAKPRHTHFFMMSKGIWHGLCGKMGRYKE